MSGIRGGKASLRLQLVNMISADLALLSLTLLFCAKRSIIQFCRPGVGIRSWNDNVGIVSSVTSSDSGEMCCIVYIGRWNCIMVAEMSSCRDMDPQNLVQWLFLQVVYSVYQYHSETINALQNR